ncbi:hypothetical protein ABTF07_20280, partial [Acinetobacter baumannii]
EAARPGSDYVLVLNRAALDRPFDTLLTDLAEALRRAAAPKGRESPRFPPDRTRTDRWLTTTATTFSRSCSPVWCWSAGNISSA